MRKRTAAEEDRETYEERMMIRRRRKMRKRKTRMRVRMRTRTTRRGKGKRSMRKINRTKMRLRKKTRPSRRSQATATRAARPVTPWHGEAAGLRQLAGNVSLTSCPRAGQVKGWTYLEKKR